MGKLAFVVQEHYTDGDHLKVREVEITGTSTVGETGYDKYDLTRTDTGAEIYPYELAQFKLIGERDFVAWGVHSWGKAPDVESALRKMLGIWGLSKAQQRKLENIRYMGVWECVQRTGYVNDMGGVGGLMLKPVRADRWLDRLWDLAQVKKRS